MRMTTTLGWMSLILIVTATATAAEPLKVAFETHRIDNVRSEACGVGDFNNDGKLDIVAGPFLYLAPDWKPTNIREIAGEIDGKGDGYTWDFMNAPLDVDGDGLLDIVSCSWHGKLADWYRNPGSKGGLWKQSIVEKNGNYETGYMFDIDGDGKANEILPSTAHTSWYEVGKKADGTRGVLVHSVCEKRMVWGGGVGDVNGDGRPDILRPNAWFEAPADPRGGKWIQHPLALGSKTPGKVDHTPQILVYDVNDDGLNDIITSSAHKYGIFWYEQGRKDSETTWKQHTIDDTWSQAHAHRLADLDNDGDLDLITGKRFRAHNGHDPGGDEPPGVYWYELTRGPVPVWKKHVICFDKGIGAGMNIPVVDLDGDGDLDIVVTGKWGGPAWFENKAVDNK